MSHCQDIWRSKFSELTLIDMSGFSLQNLSWACFTDTSITLQLVTVLPCFMALRALEKSLEISAVSRLVWEMSYLGKIWIADASESQFLIFSSVTVKACITLIVFITWLSMPWSSSCVDVWSVPCIFSSSIFSWIFSASKSIDHHHPAIQFHSHVQISVNNKKSY